MVNDGKVCLQVGIGDTKTIQGHDIDFEGRSRWFHISENHRQGLEIFYATFLACITNCTILIGFHFYGVYVLYHTYELYVMNRSPPPRAKVGC